MRPTRTCDTTVTTMEKLYSNKKMIQIPHPPATPRTARPRVANRSHTLRPLTGNIRVQKSDNLSPLPTISRRPESVRVSRAYYPKRVVPEGMLSHGTFYSETSEFYDLYSIVNYYNWKYKLSPRLPMDRRPIWK